MTWVMTTLAQSARLQGNISVEFEYQSMKNGVSLETGLHRRICFNSRQGAAEKLQGELKLPPTWPGSASANG